MTGEDFESLLSVLITAAGLLAAMWRNRTRRPRFTMYRYSGGQWVRVTL